MAQTEGLAADGVQTDTQVTRSGDAEDGVCALAGDEQ